MIAAGALIVIDTRHLAQVDPAEQRAPCRRACRWRRPRGPTSPSERGRVGVVAHQRRHVERRREPRLPVIEQVAEALVGLLGRPEPGELAHRPQAPAVHGRVDPAGERVSRPASRSRRERADPPPCTAARPAHPTSVVNDASRSGTRIKRSTPLLGAGVPLSFGVVAIPNTSALRRGGAPAPAARRAHDAHPDQRGAGAQLAPQLLEAQDLPALLARRSAPARRPG